ncbi:MAG: GGDEF domain-containing response regulator, partial [Proteobacteria bacterium]|nr:GGDEF domain-containing response regulator [Pseudomonadota bacterium]
MPQTKKHSQRIVFLSSSDELRFPYEHLLKRISLTVDWFETIDGFLSAPHKTAPVAVVVDIDLLSRPLEPHLEHLRMLFPHSELIAISSVDSAQIALLCTRSGMSDYLLKPISPEELLWCIKKSIQKTELFQKLQDPEANFVRALTQISACSTPSLIRLTTIEFLSAFFYAEGAAWITISKTEPDVVCSIPKGMSPKDIRTHLPDFDLSVAPPPAVSWLQKNKTDGVLLTCLDNQEAILFWGMKNKTTEEKLLKSKILLEHTELSLLNLEKFEEIKQQTFIDELTGLYNSRYLKYAIATSINKCKGRDKNFGVLFIDIDYFKSINTEHGHIAGSEFLIAIGKSIRNTVREIDPVFRYGGDEFIVVLNDTPQEGAL